MADWKKTAQVSNSLDIATLGDGLAVILGALTAKVTSGIGFDAEGNIVVNNGSGIALDTNGKLTVNAGVGLALDTNGFIIVNPGVGLAVGSGQVYIPGGAITNALLAALAVAQANIQANAVGTVQIQAAAITTALIANAAITNALIGNAAVGTANIQDAAITNALIANLAVGTAQIADAAIVDAKIANLSASKLTAGTITASISISTSGEILVNGTDDTMTLGNGVINIDYIPSAATALLSATVLELVKSPYGTELTPYSFGLSNGSGVQFGVLVQGTAQTFVQNMPFSVSNGPIRVLSGNTVVAQIDTGGSISANIVSANAFSGSHMQNVGSGDSPSFAGLTVGGGATNFGAEVFAPAYAVPGWGFIDSAANSSFNSLSLPNGGFVIQGHAVSRQTVGGVAGVLVAA